MADSPEYQTVTDEGKPVPTRFQSVAECHALFSRLTENDGPRAYDRAKIQGLIDGNRPWDSTILAEIGQAWRSNINTREAKATIRKAMAGFWELLNEVPTLVEVDCTYEDQQAPDLDAGRIIAEEYTRMLRRWDCFVPRMMLMIAEMLKFGLGFPYFPRAKGWKIDAAQRGAVRFPSKAKMDLEALPVMYILGELSVSDLFDTVIDKNVPDWNQDAIKKALLKAYKGTGQEGNDYSLSDWEDYQKKLKHNDLGCMNEDLDELKVVHCWTKETSGKVSHYIMTDDGTQTDYLYEGFEVYDKMEDCAQIIAFEMGDGYYESSHGLGVEIFAHLEASNRMVNSTFDAAMLGGSMIVKNTVGREGSRRILRIGPVTELPTEYEPVNQSFSPAIDKYLGATQFLHNILRNNIGQFRPRNETPGVEKTAAQVRDEAHQEARFEKFEVALFYGQTTRLHRAMFKRLTASDYNAQVDGYEEREKFFEACERRGVPREYITPEHCEIRSSRALGMGSTFIKNEIAQTVLSLSGAFDERGKKTALRDRIAAISDYEHADRYVPFESRDAIPTSHHTIAGLENNDFAEGRNSIVGTEQPHLIHFEIHIQPVLELIKRWNNAPQTIVLEQAAQFLPRVLQHCQEHLNALSGDPLRSGKAKGLGRQLKEIAAAAKPIMSQAERVQKEKQKAQQEAQQRMMQAQSQAENIEMQLKLRKMEQDFQLELKRQNDIAGVRQAKAEHAMMLDRAEVENRMQLERETASKRGEE